MISVIAFIVFIIILVIQILFLITQKSEKDNFSHYLLLVIAILLFIEIINRSIIIKFVALTNTFESLFFFSGVICLILFAYKLIQKNKTLPFIVFCSSVIAFILFALASSPIASKVIKPPVPALQSAWLIMHVAFAFIGEAFFAFSFAASIYYLNVKDQVKKDFADRLVYTSIGIGYPVFTAGALIFGAIWAQYAWGRFWGWDPKETFALITWLVYTLYLHVRLIKKSKTVSIWIAIIGFLLTLFTFFGVNYLLSGLHSYQ